jgi:hypothetical protein
VSALAAAAEAWIGDYFDARHLVRTPAQARAKLDWMFERIRVPRARELADPLHRRAPP